MSDRIYTRKELQDMICPLVKKYNATDALLFGSYARNEATPDSDIDVIIIGGTHFIATDIFAIAEELFEASGKRVDVYELQEVNVGSPLYENIMREGVTLQ